MAAGTLEMRGLAAAGGIPRGGAAARAQADRPRPACATEQTMQAEADVAGKAAVRRRAAAARGVAPRRAPRSEVLVSWLMALALLVAIAIGSVAATYHAGRGDPAVRPIVRGALGASAPAPWSRDDAREPGTRGDE